MHGPNIVFVVRSMVKPGVLRLEQLVTLHIGELLGLLAKRL